MKRITLTETFTVAVAIFALVFTISATIHLYHLTQAGLVNWKY